jgi:hypothetical protein
VYTASPRWL